MRRAAAKNSMTLIEIIVTIVVLSIAIPPLLRMISDVMIKHTKGETYYKATILGRDLLEKILTKRFDEKTEKTGGEWSDIGPDSGETDESKYDDVDDYDGFSDEPVNGYTRSVSVHYVDPDNSPSNCLNGDQNYPLDCYKDDKTLDYKRIDITVHHNLIGNLYFSSIVSSNH